MKDRNIKKVVYLVFMFVSIILLTRFGQFNGLSYLVGMISVYLSMWCYRG